MATGKVRGNILAGAQKPTGSLSALSIRPASQNRYGLMPKPKIKRVNEQTLNRLLRFVVEGQQDQVERLIKTDSRLLLAAGTVTDLSGRKFEQITAFQYALWAWDWHLWKMIQKYLSPKAQAEQLAALESKSTAHGKHFDLQPLIDVLQTYVDHAKEVWKYDQRAVDYWCNKVSEAQKLLPVSVINEYCCQDRPFYHRSFTENSLPRTRQFYDQGDWHSAELNGVVRGVRLNQPARQMKRAMILGSPAAVAMDIKALQSLLKIRTRQLEQLQSQLQSSSPGMGLG